ncbi:uncharacterized protein METZ01_LOCUS502611 [marine metagenome]|uniref:Uncharacterized protein n=1 Tax=marine metagenome TaxID=408172 RepID=A0A383DYX0_9ZZZZ
MAYHNDARGVDSDGVQGRPDLSLRNSRASIRQAPGDIRNQL